jgi:glycosyltransferase involved in cell wall biosynthesis
MIRAVLKIVVQTPEVVGPRMAGPGIRATYLARELAKHFRTTLIGKVEDGDSHALARGSAEAEKALNEADVVIGQPARSFRRRKRTQKLVFDLFDPLVVELRELYGARPSLRQRVHLAAEWWRLTTALRHGDLLIAATPAQRQWYAKLQASDAPWVEVPFGIDLDEASDPPLKRDDVIVWNGGVWEWLDPATAIDAVVRVNADGLQCRLLFLGRARPNKHAIDRRRESRFDALLARGGAAVEANGEWIPYAERLSWLRQNKAAIMLHRPTGEAALSIRTRLFDAIAAAVPVIATTGGFAAGLVERERLGIVVPPEDVGAVAAAIRRLLRDDDFYAGCVHNLQRVRSRFSWQAVTQPLIEAIRQWEK